MVRPKAASSAAESGVRRRFIGFLIQVMHGGQRMLRAPEAPCARIIAIYAIHVNDNLNDNRYY
jgi:hypothetical protein